MKDWKKKKKSCFSPDDIQPDPSSPVEAPYRDPRGGKGGIRTTKRHRDQIHWNLFEGAAPGTAILKGTESE